MDRAVVSCVELADEFVRLLFEQQPMSSSLYGLPGAHDRLADTSATAVAKLHDGYSGIVARAEAIDPASLTPADRITRGVLISLAKAEIDRIDSRLEDISVSNGLHSVPLRPLMVLPQIVLDDEEKARGFLTRLAGMASYLDVFAERQRGALSDGLVPPAFLTRVGIEAIDRYLNAPDADPLRITPRVAVEGFEAERDRLLAEVVRPAYARYRAFLAEEVEPVGNSEDRPGIGQLPGGQERYAALIRAETTTERTARELHDTGLAIIEKLAAEFRALGEKAFGTGDLAEIFERLRTDPALHWRDGDELVEAARQAVARAEAVAPQWFSAVPEHACAVAVAPDTAAKSSAVAYYMRASLDGSRPGTYFANTYNAEKRSRAVSEAVAFHEAVPGHHFQLFLAQGMTGLPLMRRIARVNSFSEGWALYAEQLANEMGLYSDDVARLGMLIQDSKRAARLVVDTGMHALGWSRQKAVDYLRENTPMAPVEVETEVNRYASWPGQALGYMVGRLEIERLRSEAERELGERFDIRAFHGVVLGSGTVPLPVLATAVAEWIEKEKA